MLYIFVSGLGAGLSASRRAWERVSLHKPLETLHHLSLLIMKKTLITLLALTGVAAAETAITLETQIITKDGDVYGLYSQWESVKGNTSIVEGKKTTWNKGNTSNNKVLTFYVQLSDLLGGDTLATTGEYAITSFSWLGQENGNCSGGGDTLTISVGDQSITGSVQASNNIYTTAIFKDDGTNSLTLSSTDILTITLTAGTGQNAHGESVELTFIDTIGTNKLLGSSSNLNSDGTMNYWHVDKANGDNAWDTTVKTDAPVISMTMKAIPEPTTATLSLLALAGLAARRRRK